MSDIAYIADADLEPGIDLTDTVTLQTFWSSPEAVRLLIYGARTIPNAAPGHDHDEDGGEFLYLPILSHSFGTYVQNISARGIPIGPPSSGTFAPSTTVGITDHTQGKRLFCAGVVLPGGCLGVRVALVEYHAASGLDTTLTVTLRALSSVNLKLGVAHEEVRGEFAYTTIAATIERHTVTIDDVSVLGDPTLDREVEFALWLTSDVDGSDEQRLLSLDAVAVVLTPAARAPTQQDTLHPALAVREVKAGLGIIGAQFAAKIKEIYNGLNRGLWGSTPGLLPNGAPDRRRRFREVIDAAHQHQGSFCPTSTPGEIIGDGACLRDTQSMGYLVYLGETLPLIAATPPLLDHRPNQGAYLHFTDDLSVGWVEYNFRRSVPAGCGALVLRVGAFPGFFYSADSFDTSQGLFMSATVTLVAGGSDIVTRLFCGPHASPLDASEVDFGFVEVEAEDDVAYLAGSALLAAGKKGWNRGAETSPAQQAENQLNSVTYRVSQPILLQLSYPPERASETYHPTGDYDIKLRFKMRNSALLCDDEAGCLWVMCSTAPGY